MPPGIVGNAATNSYSFTVLNTSATVYYGAKLTSVSATNVICRVFNSTGILVGGQSMVQSGAGITVFLVMTYI
jgi:hypothetical protein